jgi:preprotein translocase subunit SecE
MATSPMTFVIEVRDELMKVKWPTRNEIIRLTGVVIIISALVGIFLGGLDLFFTALIQKLVTR